MIRINLAKSSNFMNAGEAGKQVDFFRGDIDLKIDWSHIKKILVMFTFPVILIVYEKYNSFALKKSLQISAAGVNKLQQEINSFGEISSVIEELIKEKERMSVKLGIIKEISKKKTLKVKSLLEIQEKMPENLWLKEIVFEKDKVLFNGYSLKDSSVQKMVKGLKGVEFIESVANKDVKKMENSDIDMYQFDMELKLKE